MKALQVTFISLFVAAFSVLLPWAQGTGLSSSIGKNGIDSGDGIIFIILIIISLSLAFFTRNKFNLKLIVLIPCVLALLLLLYEFFDIKNIADDIGDNAFGGIAVGTGIYLGIGSLIVSIISIFIDVNDASKSTQKNK